MTQAAQQQPQQEQRLQRFIRQKNLPEFVGLQRTQIEVLIERGEFPKPISLNDKGRSKAWLESEIVAWQVSRIAKRDQDRSHLRPGQRRRA